MAGADGRSLIAQLAPPDRGTRGTGSRDSRYRIAGLAVPRGPHGALRLSVNTAPLQQWAVGRELRRRIKDAFDREGLALPHLNQQVWIDSQEQSDGAALPTTR